MAIDVHAHYVPPQLIAALADRGKEIGVTLLPSGDGKPPALAFDYGFKVRPFFPKLVEDVTLRRASLDRQGIDRQLVATWPDIYGYGLPAGPCGAWHRMLNDTLAEWCADNADRFSFVASVSLVSDADAVEELVRAVDLGAVAVMIPANVEGTNIGDIPLEGFWAAAERLALPVYLHPVLVGPAPRATKYGLTQIVQYTCDTTLGLGSLLSTGLLDRFPDLKLVLSHGGGTFPYLVGRFDIMHARADHGAQAITAQKPPSAYVEKLTFDTIVHAPKTLRFLADSMGLERLVLGTDESFPPADTDPVGHLKDAGFSAAEIETISEATPRKIFTRIK